jgi:hypothetical protein
VGFSPEGAKMGQNIIFLGIEKLAITLLTLICGQKLRIFLIKANLISNATTCCSGVTRRFQKTTFRGFLHIL